MADEAGSGEQRPTLAERRQANRTSYYWSHRDKARAASDAWKAANPERARYLNRESARRRNAAKRAERQRLAAIEARKERARARRRAWYAEHRDQERARHRRFRQENPDKIREYQQRYRERHPEHAAKTRQYTQGWRDRNSLLARARGREQAAQRRANDPDIHKRYYHANLEQQRARSRDASRLRSRLRQLGLPPRIFHRTYAEQKRANEAAADAFFARERTPQQQRNLALERDVTPDARLQVLAARDRARQEQTTPQDLRQLQVANVVAREQVAWKPVLPALIRGFVRANRARIFEEIRMDSIARQLSGKPPYEAAVELARRIRIECFIDVAGQLVPDHDPARLGRLHATMFPSRAAAATAEALTADRQRREAEAQRLLAQDPARTPTPVWH